MQIFDWISLLNYVKFKHFLTFFLCVTRKIYFRVLPLPLSFLTMQRYEKKLIYANYFG